MKRGTSTTFIGLTCTALLAAVVLTAQAPQPPAGGAPPQGPPPGGAPGGRAAGPPMNAPATPQQRTAVAQMEATLQPLVQAVTAARNALTAASLATPAVPAEIARRADELAAAELKLAVARADALAPLRTGLNRLNEAQMTALRNRAAAGGGGRGGGGTEPLNFADRAGFTQIFDGKTLTGWDGSPEIWSIDDGAISAKNGGIVGTTYIIYTGARVRDFELIMDFKINGANTGLQYRSRRNGGIVEGHGGRMPDVTPEAARGRPGFQPTPPFGRGRAGADAFAKWDLGGYQFDLGGANSGNLYEQDGRGTVIQAGNVGELLPGLVGGRARLISTIANVAGTEKANEWNTLHLIARGNSLTHMVNGQLLMQAYDNDPDYFAAQGNIGLQIEGNGQIWFRNIWLKQY